MKNILPLCAMMLLAVACGETQKEPQIEGAWIEPIPGMEDQTQGIKLEADGKASSINMATLVYESWKKEGNQLILSGQSVGNGQTIAFSDTLEIENHTTDSLILKRGDYRTRYSRAE